MSTMTELLDVELLSKVVKYGLKVHNGTLGELQVCCLLLLFASVFYNLPVANLEKEEMEYI